ncbi:MAG: hypothetical protein ACT4P8_11525 [Betaproteobacteria bacterium]
MAARSVGTAGLPFHISSATSCEPQEPLAGFLKHKFRGGPLVGDRLRTHGVEPVVRAVEKGTVTRVGLKLHD